MIHSRHQEGYILVTSLMMLVLMIVLVTAFFNRSITHVQYDNVVVRREKAKALALSGIQLALSQLNAAFETPEKKEEEKKATSSGQKPQAVAPEVPDPLQIVKKLVPLMNDWQTVKLTQELDGVDGSIMFSISSEDGKIDLNQWYDFAKHQFKSIPATPAYSLKEAITNVFDIFSKGPNQKEIVAAFEKFLQQRQDKLDDVTELLHSKELQERFKTIVFRQPAPKGTASEKQPLYLTDLFTVWSNSTTPQVWFLSDALATVVHAKRTSSLERKKKEEILKSMNKEMTQLALPQLWEKLLQKLYGVEYKALPKNSEKVLSTKIEPKTFSVVSYGTAGSIVQKIFAIITKVDVAEFGTDKFMIKKVYWL